MSLAHQDKSSIESELKSIFTSLDFCIVGEGLIDYLSQKVVCENALWISGEEANSMLQSNKEYAPLPARERGFFLLSQKKFEIKNVIEVLNLFVEFNKSPLSKSSKRSSGLKNPKEQGVCLKTEVVSSKKGFHHLLIPVLQKNLNSKKSLDKSKKELGLMDRGKAEREVLGYFLFENCPSKELKSSKELAEKIIDLSSLHLSFCIEHHRAKDLSYMDDVTSLHNQRYLPLVLDKEMSRAYRNKSPFSVLFMDIDYFKNVNDTRGHLVGSKILSDLSSIIKKCIRTNDYAFRYGGDEFVIIVVDAGVDHSKIVAERIRKTVEETTFEVHGHELNITVSIGIAAYPQHAQTKEDILKMADHAMYCAKNKSRNLVYITAS